MAQRKAAKRGVKQQAKASKHKSARRPATKQAAGKRAPAKRAASRKPARRAGAAAMPAPRIGLVTHTELASSAPSATKRWCEIVLKWQFGETVPTEAGPYHMWRSANDTGGGIRKNMPPEAPGTIPYVEVASIHATFDAAIAAGASLMAPPMQLPSGMGWIAIVMAPGGVAIGFWAPR